MSSCISILGSTGSIGRQALDVVDKLNLRVAEGETSTYYADSDWYSNVSYRVFEFDTGVLTWDEEGVFYRME